MTKLIIQTDTVEGFFDRARKAAQKADRGESFQKSEICSFEDLQEIFMALSKSSRHLK
jgi:predicted transcriptional regulator